MRTYYDVLQVDVSCTTDEIKQAFRRRAKELHPDVTEANEESVAEMRLLIQAYRTLVDPEAREQYDRTHFIVPPEFRFDYREFLQGRSDDMVSQSKLIFFDLLHSHEDDALSLFDYLSTTGAFDLSDYLDREDFMDCAFLLAEAYETRGTLLRAYELLVNIVDFELSKPYFRHFFYEVIARLRRIVCYKMPGFVSNELLLECLEELIERGLSPKETAFFYKKAAEVHLDEERFSDAATCLEKGLELNSKLSGARKLKERIQCVQSEYV